MGGLWNVPLGGRVLQVGTHTLTSPGAVRAKTGSHSCMGNCWEHGEIAPESLGLWWVGCIMRCASRG